MAAAVLVDAGPLVALVDAGHAAHASCAGALRGIHEPLLTVWPCVVEAVYLLDGEPRGQQAVLEIVEQQRVELARLDADDVPRLRELMHKYRDLPMDLADAALVRVAEREGLSRILTLDRRHFSIYRIGGRRAFSLVPVPSTRR